MKNYYAIELEYLRELGAEYAREHPAIAPLLATRSTDPDVERLLEGTAFLCGLINERLDQNFPEVIQTFLDITAPELLRSSPSQTLVQFLPLPQVQGVQTLAAGSALESIPVSGTSCTYTIPGEMPIVPVTSAVSLLEDRSPDAATLHLHLHDELSRACQWFYLLLKKCTRIRLEAAGTVLSLSPDALVPDLVARDPAEGFAASGSGAMSPLPGSLGAAWLRNYFILPEQFLFLRLEGGRSLSRTENAHQLDIFFRLQDCRDIPAHLAPDLLRCNVSWALKLPRLTTGDSLPERENGFLQNLSASSCHHLGSLYFLWA
ncbi:MAG TPA: type VI secretion system baseplate subunit TssF [Candidatus Desulfovibrio intestinipullorum]|uniref:Type VI secretion system baseplate subunit TssF n=1 Tax=Candidatus Desulfovibrio intestinipullorum TaxID=2838536 RepID=A0A9D1TNV7_9BACT|nr:type VI secretion system baseplate subunit TssF [Candidatus Desulfovibrio intestinipullorum]